MSSGWIKVHREILDNPVVCKDGDHMAVWMFILLKATHKEIDVMFNGSRISLLPGQVITSRKSISNHFGVSESKVQRILKTFEIEHQIEQLTSSHNRLLTVVNWTSYQNDEQENEQPVNNQWTATEQPVNTNKNVKNKRTKECKEDISEIVTKYGSRANVKLTQDELNQLTQEYPDLIDDAIEFLSLWLADKGDKSKSKTHNLTMRRWVIDAAKERKARSQPKSTYQPKKTAVGNFTGRDYQKSDFDEFFTEV